MRQEIYARRLKLSGEEHAETIREAICYASGLMDSTRFKDAKSLMHKTLPVARRVLGPSHDYTLRLKWIYGKALYRADRATLDDLREAVTTLEDAERAARRVLGGAHPLTVNIEGELQKARAALRARKCARETPGDA